MLQLYNTLSGRKENFTPLNPGKVKLYVCGVTVYDYCHIGHARTYTAADLIVRYLQYSGYDVEYVRNITDVDDKIIKRANENKEDINQVTTRYTQAMHEDFNQLGLLAPTHEPRATEFIPQMVTLISEIIANGHGYVADNGDVYFDVRSFKDYGCLSHHDLEQLESGARVAVAEVKRDPLDFILWKLAKPSEPSWDSPWGKGRPGWHIECSAMSMQLLGQHFDIHAGGRDLIFPHHENEIAQSSAATHKKFVNYWLHAGFLQIDKEKMSKSLGNFVTIRDALKEHQPEVLRFFFISSHYRSPLVYTNDALHQAQQALARLYTALRGLAPDTQAASAVVPAQAGIYLSQFQSAMDDDLNTPVALSVLFEMSRDINKLKETNAAEAANLANELKKLGGVLGILQQDPEEFFRYSNDAVDANKIEALIAARQQARINKQWAEADRIRQELLAMNIAIEDGANGTTWKIIQ